MKFGEFLKTNKDPEWAPFYIDYDQLKKMISGLEDLHLNLTKGERISGTTVGTSLSVPLPTNSAGMPREQIVNQEKFYSVLEAEMKKIESFTQGEVKKIRLILADVESKANQGNLSASMNTYLTGMVENCGEVFLRLEKYVNLNFTGFHKILKKHDKRLPNPCRAFYTARLRDQSWVRGDYSDVIVSMSRVYSALRGDEKVEEKENSKQAFVRSTRKYWVHTEDISAIKYTILQHLPVFLQKQMAGETDSQLVNSVYLDNTSMELYHGRLDKTPGAIALRLRWYGTGIPEVVFVERKTHRDSWAGEMSVKERFIIKESQVRSLLDGKFDIDGEAEKLRKKGKSEEDVEEWLELVTEIVQAINSKMLVPTMRTQYMRTAFQIPFDATVRVSLDTNLTMINERTKETMSGERWYRDPFVEVPADAITRFPHGVLEVKLQLEDVTKTPAWVNDLLHSGRVLEVHKFSKFIHGSAVLMPEDVQSVPYWIDDATLADSIVASGAGRLLETNEGANQYYQHLLPHDEYGNAKQATQHSTSTKSAMVAAAHSSPKQRKYTESAGQQLIDEDEAVEMSNSRGGFSLGQLCGFESDDEDNGTSSSTCGWCCDWARPSHGDHVTTQKVEPKLFFANERTFIKWLHMAVLLSSISIGVLAFSPDHLQVNFIAMIMLPLALLFIMYATATFVWRSRKINSRDIDRWDDPRGPVLLTSLLIFALCTQFVLKVQEILEKNAQALADEEAAAAYNSNQ